MKVKKNILFTLIGVFAVLPIQVSAKSNLVDIVNQISSGAEVVVQYQKDKKLEANRTNQECSEHYPMGKPLVMTQENEKIQRRSFFLCQINYAVQYDPATKNPIWVSEVLNGKEQQNTFIERVDNFQPHPMVPRPAQASLSDYKGSKFDRGHMAPAADMLNEKSMEESFYLTNMVPQVGPNMNRGIWADLESVVRKWSISRGQVLVITGPIYEKQPQTIGKSNVWVPTHIYKAVLDPSSMESLAFIIPNRQIVTRKTNSLDEGNPDYPQTTPQYAVNCGRTCIIDDFIVPLSNIESVTGLNLFPKANIQNKVSKGRMWNAKF